MMQRVSLRKRDETAGAERLFRGTPERGGLIKKLLAMDGTAPRDKLDLASRSNPPTDQYSPNMKTRSKPLKLRSAWVITWFGSNTHKLPPVAILNYRKNARTVAEAVELLYATKYYNAEEKLRYAKSPKDNPYRALRSPFGRITCGHNPLLFARLVTDLKVEKDGLVTWTEPPSERELRQELIDAGILC